MSTETTQEPTTETLAEALTCYLSAQAGKRVELAGLRRISDGWESDVYAFDAVAAGPLQGEAGRVLRLYFGANAGPTALGESRALDLLKRAGYPVPRVDLVEPSTEPLGRAFLIMERVTGDSLGRQWRSEDGAVREAATAHFCDLFATLHTLRWEHLSGAEKVPQYTIAGQLDLWREYTAHFGLKSTTKALAWLEKASYQVKPHPFGLVHWDFHHENILVDETNQPWVIDWTQFQATDVRFDLAWTLVLLASERDEATAAAVRAGYLAQRGWEAATAEAEMRFFEAAACAKRLLSVLISLRSGADAVGMRPGAEAVISSRLARIAVVYRRWLELTNTPLPEVAIMLAGHL